MSNESKCATCLHRDICRYKERYLNAVENANQVVEYANLDFVGVVCLDCKYYVWDVTIAMQ